jgi:hypothetical protein
MTPAALALILVAADLPTRPTMEPRSAADLYNVYRWYGLPLPPKSAYLNRYTYTEVLQATDGKETSYESRTRISLRFVTRPPIGTQPAQVLEGIQDGIEIRASRLQPTKPTPDCLEGMDREWHSADAWLVFSAQAYHLGWRTLAQVAFDRGKKRPASGVGFNKPEPKSDVVLAAIRSMAWDRAYDKLTDSNSDRRKLLHELRQVAQDDPEYRDGDNAELVRLLGATLSQKSSPPGTIDSEIDGLTDCSAPRYGFIKPGEAPTAYTRLVGRGFAAVTFLLRHTDDERLTRSPILEGFNRGLSIRIGRVNESCRAIITGLSDGEVLPYREVIQEGPDGRRSTTWFQEEPEAYRVKASAWLAAAENW